MARDFLPSTFSLLLLFLPKVDKLACVCSETFVDIAERERERERDCVR